MTINPGQIWRFEAFGEVRWRIAYLSVRDGIKYVHFEVVGQILGIHVSPEDLFRQDAVFDSDGESSDGPPVVPGRIWRHRGAGTRLQILRIVARNKVSIVEIFDVQQGFATEATFSQLRLLAYPEELDPDSEDVI